MSNWCNAIIIGKNTHSKFPRAAGATTGFLLYSVSDGGIFKSLWI